eukprot:TRINITY_DN7222_c0_g1_i1.p1 TRINITY_DN7222_c0_g1~~TRINITY_DN7222_c0_g1_i1.p1  ORF type:complete len:147 (-),score=0.98 TRINITY_DN7222_c0_g1_i1:36-476(-)
MEFHLLRLKWVIPEQDEETESTTNIYQLGCGRNGPKDRDLNYPLMQLHLSKKKFRLIDRQQCIKKDPTIYWFNPDWSICIKGTDKVRSEQYDSGGPGLSKDKSGPKNKRVALYFLHYLTSRNSDHSKMEIAANLETKRDIIARYLV